MGIKDANANSTQHNGGGVYSPQSGYARLDSNSRDFEGNNDDSIRRPKDNLLRYTL
jgi:hypothetical protein